VFAALRFVSLACAEDDDVDVDDRRMVGWKMGSWSSGGEFAAVGSSDSGMSLSDNGSTFLLRLGGAVGPVPGPLAPLFDKPRAAAAHDSSVDKLARRASSC